MAALVKYAVSGTRGARILLNWKRGGGRDGRCNVEEPMGRYAAYSKRTITVENGLAITLGDGALCRRLGRRNVLIESRLGDPGSCQPTEVGQGKFDRMSRLAVKTAVTG
jgi:hypothetical protein